MLVLWVHASDKRRGFPIQKILSLYPQPVILLSQFTILSHAMQHNPNECCCFWKGWKFTLNCSMLWAESCCPLLPYISLILGVLQKYRNRCKWILQFYSLCTSWPDWLTDTPVGLEEYRACTCKLLVKLSVLMHGEGQNSKYTTGFHLNLLKTSSPVWV